MSSTKQTKTSYTPGPWVFTHASDVGYELAPSSDAFSAHASLITSSSNACLIAAAPELLEALEMVLNRLDLEDAVRPGAPFILSADREDLRAIIAKARGES